MIILGLSYLADAGACIVRDGKVVSVINEERLNRKKLCYGLPHLSIDWVLADAGLRMQDIDVIVTQGYCRDEEGIEFVDEGMRSEYQHRGEARDEVVRRIMGGRLSAAAKEERVALIDKRLRHEDYVMFRRNLGRIRELRAHGKPIKVLEHHFSHASSAYFMSGWDDCYVLTADGWGEMESNILCRGKNGRLRKLHYSHSFDSLGYFYGSITDALGFIPHRHEGKVLGLAARGRRQGPLPWMKGMIRYNSRRHRFEGGIEKGVYLPSFYNPHLAPLAAQHSREDVAAAAQHVLERCVLAYIRDNVPPGSRLALSGGIFASVLLNQRILSLPNIKDIFVYPQMGDGGLAVGSALCCNSLIAKQKPVILPTLYWGPAYSNDDVASLLDKSECTYERCDDIEQRVAELLAGGEVVMRFAGRMEYGPRALGNRSILCSTTDPTANTWLNRALRRSEFMPFAPATLYEHAEKCYKGIARFKERAMHMTLTFNCTSYMKKVSPAVVHVDGTARPQLVSQASNASFYAILKHYHELTGIPSLVNTSFNMHEEPIVCSPDDALRAFTRSKLEYLAIEDLLVRRGGRQRRKSLK